MSEKNVLEGDKQPFPVYRENTGKFFYKALLSRKGDEAAFINDRTGEILSCEGLLSKSITLCQSLTIYGVLHDKVIALCSENHINYITIVFGALYAGVPIVFINPAYTEYELQHALDVTKPDMIFCSTPHLDKFLKLKSQNSYIRKIVTIDLGDDVNNSHSFANFTNVHSYGRLTNLSFTTREVDVDNHIAFIMFSSGTTGLPKGVTLTHLNINAVFATLLGPDININYDTTTFVQILPLFHIYGLMSTISCVWRNRNIVIVDKFDPETYLKCIEKYKIPVLMTVPPLVQFLLKSDLVEKYDLSSVKEVICGAAPLGRDLIEATKKKFNLKLVRNGYGMTEVGLSISLPPLDVDIPGSVGSVFPGMSCVVKDPTTGENLGPKQEGEICMKGLMVTKGYYKDEEATKKSFTKDGWFKSGDIGYYDENGYLYIVDRIKELIKYKGFQVAPAELEQILVSHPKIQDAGVIGIPDQRAGELPLAFIVKQPNTVLAEEEIHRHMEKFVSHNKQLHGGIIFTDSIPRNPSGKIIRRQLKDLIKKKKSKL